MNVTEAIHTMTLLTWLTDPHQDSDQDADKARTAAAALAEAVNRRLGAGLTADQVTARWSDLLTSCAGCPTCPMDGRA